MRKPSSTSPSMKAACSSQPSCSLIGREASHPGPCTSRTAKLAMAGQYCRPPTIPPAVLPGASRPAGLESPPGDDPAVRTEAETGQAEPLAQQRGDRRALDLGRLRAVRRTGHGEQRAGKVVERLPAPVVVADRHD